MTCGAPASWRLPASTCKFSTRWRRCCRPRWAPSAVGKLENQRLLLVVPGPAHAAKLRQLAPRIAQSLADQGWNLNEIAVKVQAGLPKPGARQPKPPKEAQPLGDTALGAFETLHHLRPGPLADAVAKLLKHHKE